MTRICVSLAEKTTEGVVGRMVDLGRLADLFEIRADMINDLDMLALLRARTKPLIFTCRSAAEGGDWKESETARRMTLLEAVKRGFEYIDVEYESEFLDVMVEKAGKGLILSFHDLEGTPEDLDGLYQKMSGRGADVVKIAVTPRSVADVGRLLAFARRTGEAGSKPLVAIAMGPLGLITRVVGGRYGAPFTFASAAWGAEAAPGQIPARSMSETYRVRSVTKATKVYGILGSDVGGSLSPVIHNEGFAARGFDAVYVPLQADGVDAFVAAIPDLGLSGFSVTRPYKTEILRHCQEVEEAAALCGSVNTVVVHDGTLRGFTTDGLGVTAPLRKLTGLKGRNVVILGAGGAARAAAMALRTKGARVTVFARNEAKAAAMAASVGCAYAPMSDLEQRGWDVIINATPVGSRSAPDETPLPTHLHRREAVVFDMVYDPLETRLLREARAAGSKTVSGIEMLLAQAVVQFETWTALEAPFDVMRSALLQATQEGA